MKLSMIKKLPLAIVTLACSYTMYIAMKSTAPSTDAHANVLTEEVEKMLDKLYTEKIVMPEESKQIASYLYYDVTPKVVDKILNGKIDLSDFDFLTLGTIKDSEGDTHIVSLGIFGQVFTFNEDIVQSEIEQEIATGEYDEE
jgi:hypothetical protein